MSARRRRLLSAATLALPLALAYPQARAADPQTSSPRRASRSIFVQGDERRRDRAHVESPASRSGRRSGAVSAIRSGRRRRIAPARQNSDLGRVGAKHNAAASRCRRSRFLLPPLAGRAHDAVMVRGDGDDDRHDSAGHGVRRRARRGAARSRWTAIAAERSSRSCAKARSGSTTSREPGSCKCCNGRLTAQNSSFERLRVRT